MPLATPSRSPMSLTTSHNQGPESHVAAPVPASPSALAPKKSLVSSPIKGEESKIPSRLPRLNHTPAKGPSHVAPSAIANDHTQAHAHENVDTGLRAENVFGHPMEIDGLGELGSGARVQKEDIPRPRAGGNGFKPSSKVSNTTTNTSIAPARGLNTTAGSENPRKRKEPDGVEDSQGPSKGFGASTIGNKRAATALGLSTSTTTTRSASGTRSVSADSGFRPSAGATTTRAGAGLRPTATRPPVASRAGASAGAASASTTATPRSRLAASTSTATGARSRTGMANTSNSVNARPIAGTARTTRSGLGSSTSSSSAAALGRSVSGRPGAAAPPRAGLGRSVNGTSAGPSVGSRTGPAGRAGSAIGSGLASAAAVQSHGGRIENMEKTLVTMTELMKNEQEKRLNLESNQTAMQQLLSKSAEDEREARRGLSNAGEEMAALRSKHAFEVEDLERRLIRKERENKELEDDMRDVRSDLDITKGEVRELKLVIQTQSTSHLVMTSENEALKVQVGRLQREIEDHLTNIADMKLQVEQADSRVVEVEEELRTAETIRRKLHNQIQELKGNIRVFARVRPALSHEREVPEGLAQMDFGPAARPGEDSQQQLVLYKSRDSALGNTSKESIPFAFDKVFQPSAGQQEVFEEISMLTQSVLDGYNVCIFAYGQTGSGKSWTMEGGRESDTVGMIPRAMEMVFREAAYLRERGWEYKMGGQYVEIYNEQINDLFGDGTIDGVKHEIKHEGNRTRVTGIDDKPMSSSEQVADLLVKAGRRRAVAATLMNERSSRSHSVFSLRVTGKNSQTGEACEGILNLVDLAGSERLDKSGTADDKDRRKETININKSLSSLQNVISKLAEKAADSKTHVNYRDSQLTYLLQNSLSGQSKTLMFCNISPMAGHINETLNSLRFATKVNSTTIGSAKKQVRQS